MEMKGALLRVTTILNERFLAAWTCDGLRDYLHPMTRAEAKDTVRNSDSSHLRTMVSNNTYE